MSKPDILDCLANLSSDEVFTPPKLANEMLDLLPSSLWRNPKARFCDPFTKSGVFLREIVKRLDEGLAGAIPDKDERIRHILGHQVYGVAITRLTALLARRTLYCNKDAHGPRAAIQRLFRDGDGLVAYSRSAHRWKNGSCEICGASEKAWGAKRSADVENYAYPFLHDERIIKMAEELGFDVVIGNPPYQMKDGGNAASAAPIYHLFVESAKRLNPKYLVMIIPSRWFVGGKGLDDFRDAMLHDRLMRKLVDYTSSSDCFPGVEIKGGVCYFLRNRGYSGPCEITTIALGRKTTSTRYLLEDGIQVYIRYNEAISILHKVQSRKELSFDQYVSARKPFGISTDVGKVEDYIKGGVKIYGNRLSGYIRRGSVVANKQWIDCYKIFISYAYGAGEEFPHQILNKPFLGMPGEVCSETYLVVCPNKDKVSVENAISYMRTRFFRFLVMLLKNTQHATQKVYSFVPIQDFSKPWTDEELYEKYGLDEKEIAFIESMIRPMEEAR